MNVLLNELSTTDFLLLILVFFSFLRTILEFVKLFHPAQIFLKDKDKRR